MTLESWRNDKKRGALMPLEKINEIINENNSKYDIQYNPNKPIRSNLCIDCGRSCSGVRCIICHKKTFKFKVGDFEFDSKSELDLIIKQKIKESPRNILLKDKLLLTIINELHEDVKKRNLKVTSLKILDWHGQVGKWEFCRDRFRGGIFVIGYFEPINEWHGVTLYPHRRKNNAKDSLIMALRQKWSESVKRRDIYAKCENCNNINPQLHHDNITFKQISEICFELFSEDEKIKGVGDDWWLHEQEADALNDDHPAVIKMLELHKEVRYRWLCVNCHRLEHSNKRGLDEYDCF